MYTLKYSKFDGYQDVVEADQEEIAREQVIPC